MKFLAKVLYQLLQNNGSPFSQQKTIKKNLHGLDCYQATNGLLVAVAQADLSNRNNKGVYIL